MLHSELQWFDLALAQMPDTGNVDVEAETVATKKYRIIKIQRFISFQEFAQRLLVLWTVFALLVTGNLIDI